MTKIARLSDGLPARVRATRSRPNVAMCMVISVNPKAKARSERSERSRVDRRRWAVTR
jgi:hypothetical protein